MSTVESEGEDALRTQFERLCRGQARALHLFVRRGLGLKLRRRIESEDILQEVLLEAAKLYQKGPRRPTRRDEFLRWMRKVIELKTRKLARFHLQTGKRQVDREVSLSSLGVEMDSLHGGRTPSSILLESERRRLLHEAISELSPRQREVVTLVHLRQLPVKEAAGILGKTANATSVLLYAALERLGKVLHRKGM